MGKTTPKPTFVMRSSIPIKGKLWITVVYNDGSAEVKGIEPKTDVYGRYVIDEKDIVKA